MPRFDLAIAAQSRIARDIVLAGEQAAIGGRGRITVKWTRQRLEYLHEFAFLRLFAAWELTLEAIFFRSLCGYSSQAGRETLVAGSYYPTITAAETAVLTAEKKTFLLWHNASDVIRRCQVHIRSGSSTMPALQETVVASNRARLRALAAIRHRIVHDQSDAQSKFDQATLLLAGRTYLASRPGRFLRDNDPAAGPPRRWLNTLIAELTGLAGQMV